MFIIEVFLVTFHLSFSLWYYIDKNYECEELSKLNDKEPYTALIYILIFTNILYVHLFRHFWILCLTQVVTFLIAPCVVILLNKLKKQRLLRKIHDWNWKIIDIFMAFLAIFTDIIIYLIFFLLLLAILLKIVG